MYSGFIKGVSMKTKILSTLSKLDSALSQAYRKRILDILEAKESAAYVSQAINIYSSFIFLTQKQGFSAISILNNSSLLNQHLGQLIGFIYNNTSFKVKSKYYTAHALNKAFKTLADEMQLEIKEVIILQSKASDDVEHCIALFKSLSIDNKKLNYLNGWQIMSKCGKAVDTNLDGIYCKFGATFTNRIHVALKNFGFTHKYSSLVTYNRQITKVFRGFCLLGGDTVEELEIKLLARNVHHFFRDILDVLFSASKINGYDESTFYSAWTISVSKYEECFIRTKIFDAPLKPFLTPYWKKPVNDDLAFSVGGKLTKKEVNRWFGGIDLQITDEESVATIKNRLDGDINHIKRVCEIKFNDLKKIHKRNIKLQKTGKVIRVEQDDSNGGKQERAIHIEDTIASFHEYGIGAEVKRYIVYLGFSSDARTLYKELNLPTSSTINVLISLLILAHPKITPSWLQEWDLFDDKGDQVGFKQVGSQWIAVSIKNRRGATLAQQEVILNSETKKVVEFLILHTQIARNRLKSIGNIGWRKMIITCTTTKALVYSDLNTSLSHKSEFSDWLSDISLLPKECKLTQIDIDSISEIVTLRSLRRHRGLQIYLETRSMMAVADALGHKEIDLRTLSAYLPKPLMDFFNDRWLRQFQGAVLLEALIDSKYRFDAVDINKKDIEEFLVNHGISDIPERFDHGFIDHKNFDKENDIDFDEATFNISTGLLQLLFAIKNIVESSDRETVFKDITSLWYNASVYITSALKTDRYNGEDDLMKMFNDAQNNPLDTHEIRGILTC
jgi:hypothetical protein